MLKRLYDAIEEARKVAAQGSQNGSGSFFKEEDILAILIEAILNDIYELYHGYNALEEHEYNLLVNYANDILKEYAYVR